MSTETPAASQDSTNAAAAAMNSQAPVTSATEVKTPDAQAAAGAEAQKPVDAAASKPAESKPVVPEKYDLKLPEGALLDPSRVEKIQSFAKEKGLSNEQAQDLLNSENEAVSSFHSAQQEQLVRAREDWKKQVLEDKELGGDNLNKSVELAHRALNKFGSDALKDQLEKSGLGNHPELVRAFARIGKAMSEDKIIQSGNSSSGNRKSYEETFYGNNNTKN